MSSVVRGVVLTFFELELLFSETEAVPWGTVPPFVQPIHPRSFAPRLFGRSGPDADHHSPGPAPAPCGAADLHCPRSPRGGLTISLHAAPVTAPEPLGGTGQLLRGLVALANPCSPWSSQGRHSSLPIPPQLIFFALLLPDFSQATRDRRCWRPKPFGLLPEQRSGTERCSIAWQRGRGSSQAIHPVLSRAGQDRESRSPGPAVVSSPSHHPKRRSLASVRVSPCSTPQQ